jgi:hypothetical protein
VNETALPEAAVLQAALRSTTDRLAADLAGPLPMAPAWDEFEWRAAMAVSVMHGISGLLASRLVWTGPPHWQAFLAEQAEQGRRREARVQELLARLHGAAGMPLLGLKGAALLTLGVYAHGERPMSDIDLLARPSDVHAADQLITAMGYAAGVARHRHVAYEPLQQNADRAFGEHEGNPIKIELHQAIAEPLPLRKIDITAGLMAPDTGPGLNPYSSPAALMRHLLLHTAGNLCSCSVRLIQLHDLVALGARLSASDWAQALTPASDGHPAWWAVPPLRLAQRLFPDRLPAIPPAVLAACPPRLRRACANQGLTDLSLSRLGIPLLPGLAWARGPAEILGLAWQRLYPEERAVTAQIVQRQHSLAGSSWTRRPPWLKALSFLLGAPPRAQTLYSVHSALAYRPASSA